MDLRISKPGSELKSREEGTHCQTLFQAEEAKFEKYDADRWETAAEEIPNDEEAAVPSTFDYIEEGHPESLKLAPIVLTSKPDFVRALKDSKVRSKPDYKKEIYCE